MNASATTVAATVAPPGRAVAPSAGSAPPTGSPVAGRILTCVIAIGPAVALAVGIPLLWDHLISLRDVVIGLTLYAISGFGIAVGYHRLFSHRGFAAKRPLKILLAAAGSMAVEGSVIGWVAAHRRHHRFSDRDGDPHSPHGGGPGFRAQARGLAHAHVGWLCAGDTTSDQRNVADLLRDRDLVMIGHLWGVFAVGSLVLPFALGWIISGTLLGGLSTFLWAGVARMALLHHVTWSVNSICHTFGPRPFRTSDRSTNVALLSVVSFGDSFHNLHHAYPKSARHGALAHQWDPAAALIRAFERAGWVTDVHWPDPDRLVSLQRDAGEIR